MHLCYYPIVAAAPATPTPTPVHVLLLLEPLQLLPLPPRLPPLPRLLSATIISSTRTRKENVRSFSLTLWFQWEFNRVLIPLLSNLYHQFNQFFIDIINAFTSKNVVVQCTLKSEKSNQSTSSSAESQVSHKLQQCVELSGKWNEGGRVQQLFVPKINSLSRDD